MAHHNSEDLFSQVVFTNKAQCRDCYRCVRVCPVKAIRMNDGQAQVVSDRCISCGNCVRHCPQSAKSYRNDVEVAEQLVRGGGVVACSIAPSFAGLFTEWQRRRLPSALRRLGFTYVGETAIGAYHVAVETACYVERHPDKQHIASACPAVVRYVERYHPQQVDELVSVVSPMIAHAQHIRAELGNDTAVVFIGPCIAKKAEASRYTGDSRIDCVLTFSELEEWLAQNDIVLSSCEESDFDEKPDCTARLFPLEGGCVRTSGWSTDLLSRDVIAVSGFDSICDATSDSVPGRFIEPLFCTHGCIGGPAISDNPKPGYSGRADVIDYASETYPTDQNALKINESSTDKKDGAARWNLTTVFHPFATADLNQDIMEDDIRDVLEKTGKTSSENHLNCGACGYSSCREKAIAVIQGMAEPEMCMPYMKRLAEQRVDRIIETSPNGIVILDEHLGLLSMNPAFRSFFCCSSAICGEPISYLMDPEPFERLVAGETELVSMIVEHHSYNIVCHQILYPLREEKQYVGIFVNMTGANSSQKQLDKLRKQTVLQARELLEQQVEMAQKIAVCLGQNTAKAESLLENLMHQARAEA